jgi:uncharacterized protein DUF3306
MSSESFLGRWSKRKLDVKQGKTLDQQNPELPSTLDPSAATGRGPGEAVQPSPGADATAGREGAPEVQVQPAAPTLEDVKTLTAESDFTRFAAPEVTPEVKNAAMKKLFADPRYNVMDGLDVYTGDYAKPDPVPHAMLRQLASARFLGLFRQEERQEEAAREARDVADNHTPQTVAQCGSQPQAVPEPDQHADPDLQLQPDHAAPGEDPGRGTG